MSHPRCTPSAAPIASDRAPAELPPARGETLARWRALDDAGREDLVIGAGVSLMLEGHRVSHDRLARRLGLATHRVRPVIRHLRATGRAPWPDAQFGPNPKTRARDHADWRGLVNRLGRVPTSGASGVPMAAWRKIAGPILEPPPGPPVRGDDPAVIAAVKRWRAEMRDIRKRRPEWWHRRESV